MTNSSLEDKNNDRIGMFIVGPLETNCYLYISGTECIVVDPGSKGEKIAEHIPEECTLKYIVATHGHADHVSGVKALQDARGGRFAMHAADVALAQQAAHDPITGKEFDNDAPAPDVILAEGDVIDCGTALFRVLETPGHTPGGIVLLGSQSAEGIAFTGDTLFQGTCGRTDLQGGDPAAMKASLGRLMREIPARTNLFCGHGDPTTMEDELKSNPMLRGI